MADKEEGRNVMNDVWFVLGGLAILVILWFFAGGPGKADLRGLFLAPPAPLDSGEAYGPQVGTPTDQQPPDNDPYAPYR